MRTRSKNVTIVCALLFSVSFATADDNQRRRPGGTAEIKVQVDQLTNSDGVLYVALYDDGKKWTMDMKSHRSQHQLQLHKVKAKRGTVKITFKGLRPGKYAISLYHDANQSGKMDLQKNFLGIETPKESYGFSNDFNPTSIRNLRAPEFKDCEFEVKARSNPRIKIQLLQP